MLVQAILPEQRTLEIDEVLASLDDAPRLRPFDPVVLTFARRLSDALATSAAARRHPALRALAFWLRPAGIASLREGFDARQGVRRVPRGLSFHVPPANVETLLVYSWLLALLAGNRSIVRISEHETELQRDLLDVVRGVVAADPVVARQVVMIRYGHDEAVTAALSARADVRIVWGGDGTVDAIRRASLGPLATELVFPDRTSLAAIAAAPYLALAPDGRARVATAFQADAYAFDGLACSSPRLVAWIGEAADCTAASEDFWPRVAGANADRSYDAPLAVRITSFAFAAEMAIDADLDGWRRYGPSLTVVRLARPITVPADCPGGGTFLEAAVPSLLDLCPYVTRRNQTLVHYGFAPDELDGLVDALSGRGLDRLVPIGQALSFDRFWDGYDLLDALTRAVRIQVPPAR